MTRNEARNAALRHAEFLEREGMLRRPGPGRDRYMNLAAALRLLILSSPL